MAVKIQVAVFWIMTRLVCGYWSFGVTCCI